MTFSNLILIIWCISLFNLVLLFWNLQEEQRKQQRKDFKKEKKMKVQHEAEEGVDPEVAAMMGFSGFGGSKKWIMIISEKTCYRILMEDRVIGPFLPPLHIRDSNVSPSTLVNNYYEMAFHCTVKTQLHSCHNFSTLQNLV